MDGTLVDTEPCWTVAELALAERYGGRWSAEQSLEVVGFDLLDAARYMRERMGIDLGAEEIVEEMLDSVIEQVRHAVPWRPGALELLTSLTEAGVRCALVTMSWTRLVDPILAALPPGVFSAVVTGDLVDRGKPHPEPYLDRGPAPRRPGQRLPGHRGLRHRRHVGRGRGLHRAVRPAPRRRPAGPRTHPDRLAGGSLRIQPDARPRAAEA